ncbi:MAG: transglycosylase SLT domain-containing protein [Streptosporangiales bacterium]|nr:transglycosylase SLT domain-containing protein [Actinomycetes bacterium]MCL2586539.1 transglycosylase SLT domain-containing protein [Streptosporangiales bacterium]
MQLPAIPKKLPTFATFQRMNRKQKITTAGAAAGAAVVLAVTGLQATAGAGAATAADAPTGFSVTAGQQLKQPVSLTGAKTDLATQKTVTSTPPKKDLAAKPAAKAAPAPQKAAPAQSKPAAAAPAKAKPAAAPAPKTYANNLDGWIRESLDIMHAKHIPGTYEGIHRNIIRESSGNPRAINLWDINARNGIPSKGLLQVINPTFNRFHVAGTSWNIYDPVANITAACNYAADRYGSMDNVNSAY